MQMKTRLYCISIFLELSELPDFEQIFAAYSHDTVRKRCDREWEN